MPITHECAVLDFSFYSPCRTGYPIGRDILHRWQAPAEEPIYFYQRATVHNHL